MLSTYAFLDLLARKREAFEPAIKFTSFVLTGFKFMINSFTGFIGLQESLAYEMNKAQFPQKLQEMIKQFKKPATNE